MTLTGKEFQKDGVPLTEKVPAWYDEMFRGVVRSPEPGDVSLDFEGVKDSMGHGIGREKSAEFAAVPDIIRKGTVFDRQSNWKGRGYDTSVISAPVRIGDTDYAGEVVVKTGKDRQGLYLHEVENKKRLEDAFKTANGSAPQASRLIWGQKLGDVKRSSKVDDEGRPLAVHHNTDAVFDVFSKDKINSRGAYGEGFYFAEKPATYGPHQMDVYLKGTYGLPEKRAARRAGQPAQELDYVHVPDKGYWMVKDPNQIKSVQNRGTFNPDRQRVYLHEVENKKRLEDAFKTPTEGSAPQASRLILGKQLGDVKRSSKVVDGEGRPLVVHHNTDAVFDVFSKDKINSRGAYGEGFYFAEKPVPYGPHQMDVYLKGTYGLPEKRAARRAGQPAQELDYVHVPDKGYWMVKEPNQIKSVQNRGTFNPDDPNIYRTLPWAAGGAGTTAALAPGEASASVPADQYRFPVNEPAM